MHTSLHWSPGSQITCRSSNKRHGKNKHFYIKICSCIHLFLRRLPVLCIFIRTKAYFSALSSSFYHERKPFLSRAQTSQTRGRQDEAHAARFTAQRFIATFGGLTFRRSKRILYIKACLKLAPKRPDQGEDRIRHNSTFIVLNIKFNPFIFSKKISVLR